MGQDTRHPKSVYDAQYPYNRIEITESGHEIHRDDTPGKERIRESHMSGTYKEISHDGKLVNMIVGNLMNYIKQGKTTTVDKNHDEKVGGSSRVSIGGGSHTEVKGNTTHATDGDHKTMIGGDHVVAAKGDHAFGVMGKQTLKVGGEIKVKGDDKITTKIDAEAKHQYGDKLTTSSESDMAAQSKTKVTVQIGDGGDGGDTGESQTSIVWEPDKITQMSETITLEAQSSIVLKVGGSKITITDGLIILDAPEVHVTEGGMQIDPTNYIFTG